MLLALPDLMPLISKAKSIEAQVQLKYLYSRYEREEVKPSIEVAAKLADAVEVDNHLLKRMLEVQQMEAKDKEHILYTLDALIKNVKLKSIA